MRGLCYFFLSILTQVSSSTVRVTGLLGDNVTLPCWYDTQTHGVLRFCWERGKVPKSNCSKTILSSKDGAVFFRQSPRYQLLDGVTDGNVSLTILNAQSSDAGVYGCRVEIPGLFAPVTQPVTKDWTLTTNGTQEVLTTYPEVIVCWFDYDPISPPEGKFRALQRNTGIMAAVFLFIIIMILVFHFRK